MSDTVLITGATGFVGMEVLARYLERSDRSVVALVRAQDDAGAGARMQSVLTNLFGSVRGAWYGRRVDAVAADLTAPGLGLSGARRVELAGRVGTIVHSAASVSFTLAVGGGARDQRRGDPADARVRVAGARARRPGTVRSRLDGVRGGHVRRPILRDRLRHRSGVQQHLRAVEAGSRAAGPLARVDPLHDHAAEHRRRRSAQRLDVGFQRPLLAAAGVRSRAIRGRARGADGARGRRLGRLRGGCRLRVVHVRRRWHLPPHGGRQCEHDRGDRARGQPLLQAAAPRGRTPGGVRWVATAP